MAEPHVLTGAIANRAEIAGQIKHTQDKFHAFFSASEVESDERIGKHTI